MDGELAPHFPLSIPFRLVCLEAKGTLFGMILKESQRACFFGGWVGPIPNTRHTPF